MKFLVIRFSSIGDIVLTTPVVRCLKQQVQNAEVHYLTKKNFAAIPGNNPYVDKVHILGPDLGALIRELNSENFNAVIDLHNNIRSARIKLGLKARSYSFPKLNLEKWLMVRFRINRLPGIHIVERYLTTVRPFGVTNDLKGLDYFIPEENELDISSIPFREYTGIVIGAAHATKRLPVPQLVTLVAKIKGPVVLLGGKEDIEAGEQVSHSDPARIFNACGKYNLDQSASLVKQARVIVSNDTGLMHIAAAFHRPIVSIWGNTIPEFGMYPYVSPGEFSLMSEVRGLACRPCSKIGYHKCPKGHFQCMQLQDLDKIAEAVNGIS